MDPIIGAALVSGGASLLNTIYTNHSNRELSDLNFQRQVSLMDKQNAYNSPAAQMQRLADANLNPNLVYSNNPNVPSATASTHAPIPTQPFDLSFINALFQMKEQRRVNDAMIKKLNAEATNTNADTDLKQVQTFIADLQAGNYQSLADLQKDEISKRIDLAIKEGSIKDIEAVNKGLEQSGLRIDVDYKGQMYVAQLNKLGAETKNINASTSHTIAVTRSVLQDISQKAEIFKLEKDQRRLAISDMAQKLKEAFITQDWRMRMSFVDYQRLVNSVKLIEQQVRKADSDADWSDIEHAVGVASSVIDSYSKVINTNLNALETVIGITK